MDYSAQIRSAIGYINDHWNEDLSVGDIATSVHMSPFHFHRVFSAVMGISVIRFVRLKRLEHGTRLLRSTRRSIADIALECRFESQSTFTRAFVQQFGTSPGRYRRDPHLAESLFLPKQTAPMGKEESPMTRIVCGPEFEFVGLMLENLDTVNDNGRAIVGLWDEFYGRILSPDEVTPTFGVCFPGHGTTFSYMGAVERQNLREVPTGAVLRHVNSHEYAVFSHDEAAGPISEAFRHIWGTGLPATGREYKEGAPDLEVYPGGSYGKQVTLEIWIPVR